jgi:uncharacterized membrane-anchored protein YitT (DUF2179 family)
LSRQKILDMTVIFDLQSSCLQTCLKLRTSENYERICLNKFFFFFNLAFMASGWKKLRQDWICTAIKWICYLFLLFHLIQWFQRRRLNCGRSNGNKMNGNILCKPSVRLDNIYITHVNNKQKLTPHKLLIYIIAWNVTAVYK